MEVGNGPGFGVGMTDQREPTRRSARVKELGPPRSNPPTAKHTRPSGHDTPPKPAPPAPSGLGAICRPHALTRPNQRSARGDAGCWDGRRLTELPTVVHVRLRGHETARSPFRSPGWEPGASGID